MWQKIGAGLMIMAIASAWVVALLALVYAFVYCLPRLTTGQKIVFWIFAAVGMLFLAHRIIWHAKQFYHFLRAITGQWLERHLAGGKR